MNIHPDGFNKVSTLLYHRFQPFMIKKGIIFYRALKILIMMVIVSYLYEPQNLDATSCILIAQYLNKV